LKTGQRPTIILQVTVCRLAFTYCGYSGATFTLLVPAMHVVS
jgi:hypothetical protein